MTYLHSKSLISIIVWLLFGFSFFLNAQNSVSSGYDDLVELFKEWRDFERPPLLDGAPDYSAQTFAQRYSDFTSFKNQLIAIDYSNWSIDKQVDWHILLAEMNGFDFNHRVLKPWLRDPAFYKSVWTDNQMIISLSTT